MFMSRELRRAEAELILANLHPGGGIGIDGGRHGLPNKPVCYIEVDFARGSLRAGKADKTYDRWRNPAAIGSVAAWHAFLRRMRTMPLAEFQELAHKAKGKWLGEARRIFGNPAAYDAHVGRVASEFFVVHAYVDKNDYALHAGCCERAIVDMIRADLAWLDYNGEAISTRTCTEPEHRHTRGKYCRCEAAGVGAELDAYRARGLDGELGATLQVRRRPRGNGASGLVEYS
jgi:hypothetical protein